jgi:hypothetical protein
VTRINTGIDPTELCDQHLLAEYRELPRMCPFAQKRIDRYGNAGPRPKSFTLGSGHMAFHLPFGAYLAERWHGLKAELIRRGMTPTLDWRGYPESLSMPMPKTQLKKARPLIITRIQERLFYMTRKTWTNTPIPGWAKEDY